MSRLEELIQQHCPNGVEYKKIKEVYQRIKGTPITAGKMKEIQCPDGEIRIFAGGKTVIDANEADIPNANITRVPAVLVQSRGVIDAIYYDKPFTFKNEMWAYTHKEQTSVKFLYYVMKQNIQHFRDAASGMGALPQISLGTTEDFVIPVPPLPVQEEIVRILDNFTELQAELQAELQKRLQQYEYYRDKLLSFSDLSNWGGQEVSVEWKKLGEITTILRGKRLTKSQLSSDKPYAVYHGGLEPLGYYESANRTANTTMIINVGASAGTIGYSNEDFWSSDGCYCVEHSKSFDDRYIYYVLQTQEQQLKSKVRVAGIPTLDRPVVEDLLIPIPPLAEQQRIVNILDKFYTLTADLTAGLPAEIEARRKQYEYYRDKLLTFKKK